MREGPAAEFCYNYWRYSGKATSMEQPVCCTKSCRAVCGITDTRSSPLRLPGWRLSRCHASQEHRARVWLKLQGRKRYGVRCRSNGGSHFRPTNSGVHAHTGLVNGKLRGRRVEETERLTYDYPAFARLTENSAWSLVWPSKALARGAAVVCGRF